MKLHASLTALMLSCALLGLSACQTAAPPVSDTSSPSPASAASASPVSPVPDPQETGGEPDGLYLMRAGEDWLTADLDGDGQMDTAYAVTVPVFEDLGGYREYLGFDGAQFGGVTQLAVFLSGGGTTASVIFPPDEDWWGRDWPALSAGTLFEGQPPCLLLVRQDRTSNYGAADLHLFRVAEGELEETLDSQDLLALTGDALLVGGEISGEQLLVNLYLGSGAAAMGVRVRLQPDEAGEWTCTLAETPQYNETAAELGRALEAGDSAALLDGFFCPDAFLPWADGLVSGDLSRLSKLVAQEAFEQDEALGSDYTTTVCRQHLEELGGLTACQPYQDVLDALSGALEEAVP